MNTPRHPSPLAPHSSPLAGFTLVESMVAAVLLAVGILLVVGAERNARILGARGARHHRAVEAAASALDSARGRCPMGVPAVVGPVTTFVVEDGRVRQVETLLACGAP